MATPGPPWVSALAGIVVWGCADGARLGVGRAVGRFANRPYERWEGELGWISDETLRLRCAQGERVKRGGGGIIAAS